MRIAPYWIREQRVIAGMQMKLRAYSFSSQQEAQERLEAKARLLHEFYSSPGSADDVARLRRGLSSLNDQLSGYSSVITEAVVEQIDEHNVITRNRYGVEVLNSTDTCFLDVDDFPAGFMERVRAFFGGARSGEQRLLETVRTLCRDHESLSMRVYRTSRGWRIMAEAPGLTPDSPLAAQLFRSLNVDALYADLCHRQECWRARLTPKPYRVGMRGVYPHPAEPGEPDAAAAEWLAAYRAHCEGKAVCRLVDSFGSAVNNRVVQEHDARTLALRQEYPLA